MRPARLTQPDVTAAAAVLLAAAVEANSEHPLGSAIVEYARACLLGGQQQQQQQQQAANGAASGLANGAAGGKPSSADGGSGGKGGAGPALPPCRDVEVVVGQGIRAWVQLPPPVANGSAANGAACANGTAAAAATSAAAGGAAAAAAAAAAGLEQCRGALLALQAAASQQQGSRQPAPMALDSPQPAQQEAAVAVAVGSRRLVAGLGAELTDDAEAFMQEQEVRWACSVMSRPPTGLGAVAEWVSRRRPGSAQAPPRHVCSHAGMQAASRLPARAAHPRPASAPRPRPSGAARSCWGARWCWWRWGRRWWRRWQCRTPSSRRRGELEGRGGQVVGRQRNVHQQGRLGGGWAGPREARGASERAQGDGQVAAKAPAGRAVGAWAARECGPAPPSARLAAASWADLAGACGARCPPAPAGAWWRRCARAACAPCC